MSPSWFTYYIARAFNIISDVNLYYNGIVSNGHGVFSPSIYSFINPYVDSILSYNSIYALGSISNSLIHYKPPTYFIGVNNIQNKQSPSLYFFGGRDIHPTNFGNNGPVLLPELTTVIHGHGV